jgi:phage replication initiation protein
MTLQAVRASFGLSGREVAKLLEVTPSFISKIEKGEKPFPEEKQALLRKFLYTKSTAEMTVMIDWLAFRMKTFQVEKVITQVLKLDFEAFNDAGKGRNYPFRLQYGLISVSYAQEDVAMGTFVEMTGQGVRQFEASLKAQHRTWQDFFQDVYRFADESTKIEGRIDLRASRDFLKFNRVDFALDEQFSKAGNYNLFTLYEKVRKGQVTSLLKSFKPDNDAKYVKGEWRSKGLTLNFGGHASEVSLSFYEKDAEQAVKRNLAVEDVQEIFGYKNRYEVRLREKKASQVIADFVACPKEDLENSLYTLTTSIIAKYLTVKDEDGNLDQEWLEVFGSAKRYRFLSAPDEVSLEKRQRWFKRQIARSAYIQSEVDRRTGVPFMMDLIKEYEPTEEDEKIIARDVKKVQDREFEFYAKTREGGRAFAEAIGYDLGE